MSEKTKFILQSIVFEQTIFPSKQDNTTPPILFGEDKSEIVRIQETMKCWEGR